MIAKPRPKLLERRERQAATATRDREENAKVRFRSGGQCEVVEMTRGLWRCSLRASHVHHLISGIGRRNVGKSILAAHKLHVCDRCHAEIHGHVLKPVNEYERYEANTVRYERVR